MKKRNIFLPSLLLIFLITRLFFLGSGLNVLEPDEEDYRQIVQSASDGWPLYWQGQPYFEKFPLYIYLGFFLGKVLPFLFKIGPYVNLKLISIISCFGLVFLFFKHIEKRAGLKIAFISTLFLILNPLLLFYSRQGTYEAFYLFFGFLFFYFFEKYKERLNFKRALFLAALLALAVLSKHINVLFFILPGSYFLKNFTKKRKGYIYFFSIILLSAIFTVLPLIPVYLYSKSLILDQFIGVPRQFFIKHPRTFLAIFWEYFKISPFWLSWPIFLGSVLGIILAFKNLAKNLSWLLLLLIGGIYINSYYVNARSFIFIVPCLMISFSVFLQNFGEINFYKLILAVLLSLTAFQAKVAFESTLHKGVEVSLEKVKEIKRQKDLPVFATFEEDKLSRITKTNIKLLNSEATQGGIILIDHRKTELMLNLQSPAYQEAKKALDWVLENKSPTWEYNDSHPHFPATTLPNKFQIYLNET